MINITVIDRDDSSAVIEVPTDINLNLMEVLKVYEYDVLATCGGLALCATCHVQVVEGFDKLPEAQDAELDMLDTLPDAASDSRLACQLKVNEGIADITIKIRGALQ